MFVLGLVGQDLDDQEPNHEENGHTANIEWSAWSRPAAHTAAAML